MASLSAKAHLVQFTFQCPETVQHNVNYWSKRHGLDCSERVPRGLRKGSEHYE